MTETSEVEFLPDDTSAVVAAMADLADGSGWLTLDPAIRAEHTPPTSTIFGRLFTNRGPWVPRATWVPAQMDRRRPEPVSIGILHAMGPGAEGRLAEKGIDVPARWRIVEDHPKRGLVAYVPIDIDHAAVLGWLLVAGAALTKVPLLETWRATIHRY